MLLKTRSRTISELVLHSLFTGKATLSEKQLKALDTIKYDSGKYDISAKRKHISIAPLKDNVIWYETRSDEHGPYIQLLTFKNPPAQVINVWNSYIISKEHE